MLIFLCMNFSEGFDKTDQPSHSEGGEVLRRQCSLPDPRYAESCFGSTKRWAFASKIGEQLGGCALIMV